MSIWVFTVEYQLFCMLENVHKMLKKRTVLRKYSDPGGGPFTSLNSRKNMTIS